MSHNLLDLSLQTPPTPHTCIEMMSAYLWITDSMEYDKLEKEMSVVQSSERRLPSLNPRTYYILTALSFSVITKKTN